MIDFPEERLARIEPGANQIKPGSPDVFFVSPEAKQVPCTVLEVLQLKMECASLWTVDAQPGHLYYRIDRGTGPELWGAMHVHQRTEREKQLRRFYIECRAYATARGVTKQEFDTAFVRRGMDMVTLDTALRISPITPEQMRSLLHSHFVVVNLIDSPVVRHGHLVEIAECYFLPFQLIEQEWAYWQRENGGKNKYRLAGVEPEPETTS